VQKWASETPLTRASRRTGYSSCEAAYIRSFACSRRRNSSGPGSRVLLAPHAFAGRVFDGRVVQHPAS
jgi:hypothetical protein